MNFLLQSIAGGLSTPVEHKYLIPVEIGSIVITLALIIPFIILFSIIALLENKTKKKSEKESTQEEDKNE